MKQRVFDALTVIYSVGSVVVSLFEIELRKYLSVLNDFPDVLASELFFLKSYYILL